MISIIAQVPVPSPDDGSLTLMFQVAAGLAVLAAGAMFIYSQYRSRVASDDRFEEMRQVLELRKEENERQQKRMDGLEDSRESLEAKLAAHMEELKEAERRIELLEKELEVARKKDDVIDRLTQELKDSNAGADMWRRKFELSQTQLADCIESKIEN